MAKFKSLGLAAEGAKKAGAATSRTLRRILSFPFGSGTSSKPEPQQPPQQQQQQQSVAVSAPGEDDDRRADAGCGSASASGITSETGEVAVTGRDNNKRKGDCQANNALKGQAQGDPATKTPHGADDEMTLLRVQEQQPLGTQDPNLPPHTYNTANQQNRDNAQNKENQVLGVNQLVDQVKRFSLDDASLELKPLPLMEVELDPEVLAERARHLHFIGEALDMARLALEINETPVGCVLVHKDEIIAKGMNATNVTRNGTRHAEAMALSALLSYPPRHGPRTTCLKPNPKPNISEPSDNNVPSVSTYSELLDGNQDGSKSHVYPYGQKLHPDARVDPAILRECTLYVTVEPCVMCASTLRQLGIKKVYFGAVNDKFGGTGGVFSIHANSLPVTAGGETKSAHPTPRPVQLPDGSGITPGSLGTSYPPGGGDGGNVELGFEIEGGWGRDEAVALLRRFYVQENGRAPVPRKKEGRAARLAALMDKDGDAEASATIVSTGAEGDDSTGSPKENLDGDDDESSERETVFTAAGDDTAEQTTTGAHKPW